MSYRRSSKTTRKVSESGKGAGSESRKKDKGKEREFNDVRASLVVSISPVFAGNPRGGVEEMLDSMVMRYIPAFRGVVLAHSKLHFLDETATIKADCPFSNCRIAFDATVWSPRIGMKLVGKVNLCSPDHISLLVHRTFNVSIPRNHIPVDQWEFEYGPAENDPEFGPAAGEDGENANPDAAAESAGKWIHKTTGGNLGGPDGFLEFTVIGFTVANEMLSLLGSIQLDPFSPEHVLKTDGPSEKDIEPMSDSPVDVDVDGDDDSSENDTFQTLGKMANVASTRVAEEKKETEKAKKEHKRKRKDGETGKSKRKKAQVP